jgi:hypothetical protein
MNQIENKESAMLLCDKQPKGNATSDDKLPKHLWTGSTRPTRHCFNDETNSAQLGHFTDDLLKCIALINDGSML